MRGYGVIVLIAAVIGVMWYAAGDDGRSEAASRREGIWQQLIVAAEHGDCTAARALIANGAIHLRPKGAMSPLHTAAAMREVEMVQLLIAAGEDVNVGTELGWTPLMSAADVRGHPGPAAGEVAELLLRAGARADLRNRWNETALDLAVATGNATVARVLRAERRGCGAERGE